MATLSAAAPAAAGASFKSIELRLRGAKDLARRALVLMPQGGEAATAPLPVALLLHGYGPTTPWQAVRMWRDHYGVAQAHRRLTEKQLGAERLRYLRTARGDELERRLAERPYRGLVLVCPETVVPYSRRPRAALFDRYADWIAETLLPELGKRVPVATAAAQTGLCGVSMGGSVGLELWLRRPDLFSAFCGLQSDIKTKAAPEYADRIRDAIARVGERRLRLVTSRRDPYRKANQLLNEELAARSVPSELIVASGPHNASWMRQVGSVEALFWLDRVLHPTAATAPLPNAGDGSSGKADEIARAPSVAPVL